jgi:hypothetical protein
MMLILAVLAPAIAAAQTTSRQNFQGVATPGTLLIADSSTTAGTATLDGILTGSHTFTGVLLSGSLPASTPSDGIVGFAMSNGTAAFGRQTLTGTAGNAALLVYNNQYSSNYLGNSGVAALQVNTTNGSTSNTNVVGETINLFSEVQPGKPYDADDQALNIQVAKYGQNSTWQLSGQSVDYTGTPPSAFATVGIESDVQANGADAAASLYDTTASNRTMLLLQVKPFSAMGPWQAGHRYAAGAVFQAVNSRGERSIYKVTKFGTSADKAPTWPASGSVADGNGVVYAFSETYAMSEGRGIALGANADARYGVGLTMIASFDDAPIDLSQASLNKSTNAAAAGIRLARNMPIDFSGDGTAAAQNMHIIQYSDVAAALTYTIKGTVALSIADTGLASFPGQIQAPLATPKSSSSPCVTGTRTADTNYEYVCVATNTWKRAALSPF